MFESWFSHCFFPFPVAKVRIVGSNLRQVSNQHLYFKLCIFFFIFNKQCHDSCYGNLLGTNPKTPKLIGLSAGQCSVEPSDM